MLNNEAPVVNTPVSTNNQTYGLDTHNEHREDLDDPDALWKQPSAMYDDVHLCSYVLFY